MREAILDSVGELLSERPWSVIRMADVAERAEVNRQTIYQLLGSRDELAQAYVLRETQRLVTTVVEALWRESGDPAAAIEAAFGVFLVSAATNPIRKAVLDHGSDEFLSLLSTHGAPVMILAGETLTTAIREIWPFLDLADVNLVVENGIRLALSHTALPSGTPEDTAAALGRLFRPLIRIAVSAAQPTESPEPGL
ncbi:TetR family transcriptional regulator [Actinocorallia sp. API 0066]|uniref:TetR/AcrR family transcriptional regulator n=1 Tax=Actinocorallia sp. API 0066 TaxID=2896846 RepID=UPI001E50A0C2|nr:TetR family transcriptional regulator [Actinocorallia sp. API 0066]MCD0451786.1 TetR family transcriptional regulator [Actinocorallia sp. API 0066]